MHSRLQTLADQPVATGKAIIKQIRDDDVPFMAGSIAYQAFVSLLPLLVLLFLVVASVGNAAVAERVVRLTEGFLPNAAQALLSQAIIGDDSGTSSASVIGLVTLVWGSLKIFRGLDKAFSEIYETDAENSFVDQLHDGLIVLVVLGVAIIAMVGMTTLLAVFGGVLLSVLNLVVLLGGLSIAFLPMYRYFPDADLSWTDAVPGAVFAAFGWTILQFLFQFYVTLSSKGDSSGVLGAILLLLTWLYLSGFILLLGGVVNAVLLGEGSPTPKTDEEDGDASESGTDGQRENLAERLKRESDRRAELAAEVERLRTQLDTASDPETAAELTELRIHNQRLRQRLQWETKSLPLRVGLRLLGVTPPEPFDTTGRATVAAQRRSDERSAEADVD